jgi:hypothetical protein
VTSESVSLEIILCFSLSGHHDFHSEFVRLVQVLVQMPSVRTVSQKDQSSVTHQFNAVVSARRIDIEFCCNRYRAVLRRRRPARGVRVNVVNRRLLARRTA